MQTPGAATTDSVTPLTARIAVAGDNHQDKSLYGDLSSLTAAIAAHEKRKVITMDGGVFLNADMSPTGVIVHV